MGDVRIGLIGYGYWGPNLARNVSALAGDGVELAAIADRDAAQRMRAREAFPGVEVVEDGMALIQRPDVDAVVIATPVGSHHALARAALMAGKHVMVEKPLAATVAEAEELVTLADQKGLVLMVGHVFEYSDAVEYMKEVVDSGELGEILYIRSLRVNLGLYQRDINVLWDLAPHDLSIVNFLLGNEPQAVSAVGRAHVTPGVEDIVNLNLHYESSPLVTVVVSWLDPRKIREMTVIGSRKMLVYDDVSAIEKIKIFDKGVDRPSSYSSFGEFHYSYRYGDIVTPMIRIREPLSTECQHFVDCIRHGKSPRSDGHSGARVVRGLSAAQLSLQRDGAMVRLDDPAVRTVSGRIGTLSVESTA
ncbi:MAG: Gfo/Idh/MocA family oxidoreductase [Actinomycetes bacterium]|jgi:predicted dehydrogenase|nr:MAG: gfo/Idh/MocA family oxidoreductase [Actinomycetota bacterium]